MSNVETVQAIYQAFSRGDIPAILEKLDERVAWEVGETSTDVPWLQRRDGREGALAFFQSLAALDFTKFEVTNVIDAGGNRVIGLCDVEATLRESGRTFVETDEVHIWWFNDAGRVTAFRHRVDTHMQWKMVHGSK